MDETRSALIVASDQYTDPGLRRLQAPASDARALATVLRDPGIGGFEVRTLLNEPAHLINLAVEEFFADRRPGDLLLVHFSGHGVKDEDGELYFAASDTILGRLGATAVAAEFVNRRMNHSRSRRVVLLLDCCYAGAFERGLTARAGTDVGIGQHFGGRGRAVITASSAMEYAFEAGELTGTAEVPPSVFTSALVQGLETGDADQDQDGLVGLDELYDYVYNQVRAITPNQTPGKWTFGMEGELYIARRSHPVTGPAMLPAELQQAIDSPLARVRAGAVQELAEILRGRHAGKALAARLALERLTGDDSRAVAAAAAAALDGQVAPELALPVLAAASSEAALGVLPVTETAQALANPATGQAAARLNADPVSTADRTEPSPISEATAALGPPTAARTVDGITQKQIPPRQPNRRSRLGNFGAVKTAIAAAVVVAAAGTALAVWLTRPTPIPADAVSVVQVGGSSVIAAEGPNHSLDFYYQAVGTAGWHEEVVAGANTTYSAPSVAKVGNSSVIAAQGPDHSLDFYWQAIGTQPWHVQLVADPGTTYSAPSVAQVGSSSVIAAEGPDHSLDYYWQAIGTQPWHVQLVADQGTTYSAPSVAQVGNSAVIAAQTPADALDFYWQAIGTQPWNVQLVADPGTTYSAPSVAQVGSSSVIAAEGPDHSLDFYWQAIGTQPWHVQLVADQGTTYSAPSVAQVGSSSVIAAEGPDDSLDFYWETISTKPWHGEQVAASTTTTSAPSVAQVGDSSVVAAEGPSDSLDFYYQPIGASGWHAQTVAGTGTTAG